MFYQVRVRKEDKDALRFLWLSDNYSEPPDVYVMEVHIFGATSSPFVANSVLRRNATDNAKGFSPEVPAIVERSFYVDDALPLFSYEDSAIKAASNLVKLLGHGGFRLTKFMSNSKDVMSGLNLCIQDTKYWTDSEIVLHYLKNEKRRFHRVHENKRKFKTR